VIEQEIVKRLAAAKIRLRFDKVARGLVGDVRAALAGFVPDGEAVLFACTAPIRLAGRTAKSLETLARQGFAGNEELLGNQVHLRHVRGVPAGRPRVLGFVHNPGLDAGMILDIAEARLRDKD
jgi:hypothetical protein